MLKEVNFSVCTQQLPEYLIYSGSQSLGLQTIIMVYLSPVLLKIPIGVPQLPQIQNSSVEVVIFFTYTRLIYSAKLQNKQTNTVEKMWELESSFLGYVDDW